MENLARHMRIAAITISDAEVDSRRSAVTSLVTNWKKEKSQANLLARAKEIAEALGGDGTPSASLGEEVEAAIQKKSSSFLYEDRPLDVGICSGVAISSILDCEPGTHGYTSNDLYAVALWSALSFQPGQEDDRREKLRNEVLATAFRYASTSAQKARERLEVPDPESMEITIGEESEVTNNIGEAFEKTIQALRRNAVLDREEIDFLWWAQLSHSRILKRQFSSIPEATRLVSAGIEAAAMLRRFPCEVHREIVLRTLDSNPEFNLDELLEAIGDDREALGSKINLVHVKNNELVFPLLNALVTGNSNAAGSDIKRPLSEWGERALLEAGFARILSSGLVKL